MDGTARQVALATLAVLAIAVAAATLPNPVTNGAGPGSATDEQSADGPIFPDLGGGDRPGLGGGGTFSISGLCVPFLLSPAFIVGSLVALIAIGYIVYRRRDAFSVVGAYGLILSPGILIYLMLTDCGDPVRRETTSVPLPAYNISALIKGGGGGGGSGGGAVPSTNPAFLVVVGLLALVVVLVLVRSTGHDVPAEPTEESGQESSRTLTQLGAAAGRAAARIEGRAVVENEVYRAWVEMTDHLDVSRPENLTPGEFAEAAREAGMESALVEDLTDLFREVRYGEAEPTGDREKRAVEILREIETTYAGDQDGTEGDRE
ncbi:MAG: DUF4129 domain-containing protein [Halodesulfurarchaeum sp.]